jgi:phage tail sheath gpL-like
MAQNVLADGSVRLCIDPSLNFFDGKCRLLVEGQYVPGTTTITADQVVLVTSATHIEDMFGIGSQLSLALKKIFCTCPDNIEVHALPRPDLGGSVAAVYTLTVTGPATSAGRMDLFMIDSEYSISIPVDSGDSATVIAAAIVAALPDDFPYTASALAGVITFTAISKGPIGNFLDVEYNWTGRVNRAPAGVTVALVATTPGTGDIIALDYTAVLGSCCYDVYALLGAGTAYQTSWEEYLKGLWSCDTPQCFGHGYMYVSGTFGQIMAKASNSAEVSKLAHCSGDPVPPWLKTAAYAALSACTACSNPELSIQGRQYGVLECLKMPQTCAVCFTFDEQEELKAEGFVLTGPLEGGSGQLTSPYIYNDVTNNLTDEYGRPNPTFKDVSSKRLSAETAVQLAEHLQTYPALGLFTRVTDIRPGIFGTNPNLIQAGVRTWAKERIGILFSEFDNMDTDIVVQTDFEVAPACQGVPGKLWLKFRYRPPIRINRINVNMQPKLLDNCNR